MPHSRVTRNTQPESKVLKASPHGAKFSVTQGRNTGEKTTHSSLWTLDLVVKAVLTMEIPTERKRIIAESPQFSTIFQY